MDMNERETPVPRNRYLKASLLVAGATFLIAILHSKKDHSQLGASEPTVTPAQRQDNSAVRFNYASSWFTHHAQQRLTTFHFFLITISFLVLGYIQAADKFAGATKPSIAWRVLGALIGGIGLLISIGFYVLEIRNLELVNYGRTALKALEAEAGIGTIRQEDMQRTGLEHAIVTPNVMSRGLVGWVLMLLPPRDRSRLATHTWWLRRILRFFMLVFAFGAIYAGLGFPRLR